MLINNILDCKSSVHDITNSGNMQIEILNRPFITISTEIIN